MNPVVSIIVPVYKIEQYLRKCLDSVLSQTFPDYECILVDDNSPDNCPIICDEYVERDSRFRVIHKKHNEGLPMARKSGLDVATSDFVMHLDSDDWIEPNALEVLLKKQKETDADIIIGNFYIVFPRNVQKVQYKPVKDHENLMEWFLYCDHKYLWGKLYRKILFNDYVIPENNILEDAIVNVQIFSKLTYNQVKFVDTFIYNYNKDNANGLIVQLENKKYSSYTEYPIANAFSQIEKYLKAYYTNYDSTVYTILSYHFLNNGIISYLLAYNRITKDEIQFLYMYYYKRCFHLLKRKRRIVLTLYYYSILFGKVYCYTYNLALKMRGLVMFYLFGRA